MPRFTGQLRDLVRAAESEARRRGAHRIGTDHLLMGLLRNPVGESALLLGVGLAEARDALEDLDRAALAAVGVEVPDEPQLTGLSIGVPTKGRLGWSAGAKQALPRALRAAKSSKSPSITEAHLLRALVQSPTPDPALDLLAALGVDPQAIRTKLVA